jgi:hypothetical protein
MGLSHLDWALLSHTDSKKSVPSTIFGKGDASCFISHGFSDVNQQKACCNLEHTREKIHGQRLTGTLTMRAIFVVDGVNKCCVGGSLLLGRNVFLIGYGVVAGFNVGDKKLRSAPHVFNSRVRSSILVTGGFLILYG